MRDLRHKLHPRTGFVIIYMGVAFCGLIIIASQSPKIMSAPNFIEAYLLFAAVYFMTSGFFVWHNLGHAVRWDASTVQVREPGGKFPFRRRDYLEIPYSDVEGIVTRPPPRGVPPKYPLLAINNRWGLAVQIDPNYFAASDLGDFLEDILARLPAISEGKEAASLRKLRKALAR